MGFEGVIGEWWIAGRPEERWAGWIGLNSEDATPWQLALSGRTGVTQRDYSSGLTMHGRTARGNLTLLGAYRTLTLGSGDVSSEIWNGGELLKGTHVVEADTFDVFSLEIPNLINWVGPTGLNEHHQPPVAFPLEDNDATVEYEATLGTGETLRLFVGNSATFGPTERAAKAVATYTIEDGVSIERADQIALVLARFHAIIDDRAVRPHSMALRSFDDGSVRSAEYTNRDVEAASDDRRPRDPFLDTSDIDFAPFFARWFELNEMAMAAVASAAPDEHGGFVSTRLVDACNGLEHLARLRLPDPELTEKEEAALRLLRDGGINSDVRRTIKQTLLNRQSTLEMKLISVAETIGADSACWLLGDDLRAWAYSVARLRNALAHGFELGGGLTEDVPLTISALRSVTVVLRLGLLVEAGYKPPGASGELLWHEGTQVVAHPNSLLWSEIEGVARLRDNWPFWQSQIDS
ncbi:HEPN domain-containing protein [Aeromicrobium sp. CF4.19]|uniref:ApeA N-terminal domain 1-containing protein n=1 Tax=Aeromicrobium sp. CF4.19 TaxID=3373082 RepID=UPI003EE5650C